jgi:hypothetical protein
MNSSPLIEIASLADAQDAIAEIEKLKCTCSGPVRCPLDGDRPGSNFSPAIREAFRHLREKGRKGARKLLLMSSDGLCTDEECGVDQALAVKTQPPEPPHAEELRAILVGVSTGSLEGNTGLANLARLQFARPERQAREQVLVIPPSTCNESGQCDFNENCVIQSDLFADHVRTAIRSDVAHADLTVTNANDTPVDETAQSIAIEAGLSLRQAIKLANANRGNATIGFSVEVTNIRPIAPLPALSQPDITIDGRGGRLMIDGGLVDAGLGDRHEDGFLIRSNRITVNGITIKNFRKAGVEIAPLSPCCSSGRNKISNNTFVDNGTGIIVVDSPLDAPGNNHRNSFRGNTFIGTGIPIDLGDDGITTNDPCDADIGPNTLVNFPDSIAATSFPNLVRVDGKVDREGCPLEGATVEIYAVTLVDDQKAESSSQSRAFVQTSGRSAAPVGSATTDSTGSFSATVANTGAIEYSATVTDAEGNTSELMCDGLPRLLVDVLNLEFDPRSAAPRPTKLKKQPSRTFTVFNRGCARSVLLIESISRDDEGLLDLDDFRGGAGLFSVRRVRQIEGGLEVEDEIPVNRGGPVIAPGESITLRLRINPVIPPVAECRCGDRSQLRASEVLPDTVRSLLSIGGLERVALTGKIDARVRLINPNPSQKRLPPLVELERLSDDEVAVVFSFYDSDNKGVVVHYDFFDSAGNPVAVDKSETDLSELTGNMVTGQSFTVKQTFTNARGKDVGKVNVTLRDKSGAVDGPVSSVVLAPEAVNSAIGGDRMTARAASIVFGRKAGDRGLARDNKKRR